MDRNKFYNVMNLKVMARVHSLDGEMDLVTIISRRDDNDYIAEYKGVKCHAIFNIFTNCYYVDDLYTVID